MTSHRAIRHHQDYPERLEAKLVKDYFFVRETEENIYIQDVIDIDDFIRKIVPPKTSSTDIFEFSVFLYGYYNEKHIGIRKKTVLFPLFLQGNNIYKQSIHYENEDYLLSFSHYPTNQNYWHFELFTMDSTNHKIPRGRKRDKNLAKFIIRQYVKNAICQKSEVIPFQRDDFDKKIYPFRHFFRTALMKDKKIAIFKQTE